MRGKIHGPYLARLGRAHERLEKAKAAALAANNELNAAWEEYVKAGQDLERMKKEHP